MSEGEFAAAPTPVEPKQIIKYKTNKVAIIGMLLFAAIAIGLGVWLAIVLMNPPKVTTSSSDESGQDNCEVAGGGDIENGGNDPVGIVFALKQRTIPPPVQNLMHDHQHSHRNADPLVQHLSRDLIGHQ